MMGKKVIIQFLVSGLSGLLAFLALSLSARLFGAKIMGEIAYLSGLLGLVFGFSDLGLSRAHIHFTAANKGRPALTPFMVLKLVLLFLSSLAALGLGAFNRQLSLLLLILLTFEVLFRLADGLLITFEGQEKVWPQNLVRLSGKLMKLVALVILGLFWRSSLAYSMTFLTEALVIFLAAAWLSRNWWRGKNFSETIKSYSHYALPFALIMPLSYLQDNGLILIIRRFWSAEALGVYAASLGLFGLIKSFSSSLMVFFFPRISHLATAGNVGLIQKYTDMAVKLSLWFLSPVCLILFFLAEPVVTLVLGQQFSGGTAIFRWLLLGVLILAVFSPYDHVLFASRNHRPIVKVSLFTSVVVLALGWLLVPRYAGTGAALAAISGWLAGGLWQFYILKQKTGIKFLTNWRLSKVEVKYLYGLFNSFSQTPVRIDRKKIS